MSEALLATKVEIIAGIYDMWTREVRKNRNGGTAKIKMSKSVLHIEKPSQYKEFMAAHKDDFVVVDFSAGWCPDCVRLDPVYHTFPTKYPDIHFLHCDVDKLRDLDDVDSVRKIPTLRFWKKGVKVDELIEPTGAKVEEYITKHKD
ncbi:putative Thioredoxin [Blattamonas nauphoetae]|uniref:Thioredoxin n=1 Tax=Blattamonas nauphoetae TaxID=2049346 RepID=A0ABQ9YEU7_9EUKA|nr:putative Thioredoxin [Blattamonas nauphoetae]